LFNLLVNKRVDLILQGHEHGYERSRQLATGPACPAIPVDRVDPACFADDGSGNTYAKGAGPIVVVAGTLGISLRPMNPGDPEPTPSGNGYWVLDDRGAVDAFGDAPGFGGMPAAVLGSGELPTSLSATPTGQGYWIFTNRGRAVSFGDARFLGDVSTLALNGPVLDSVATPTGQGYYMVASDGGIFAFGDARFAG